MPQDIQPADASQGFAGDADRSDGHGRDIRPGGTVDFGSTPLPPYEGRQQSGKPMSYIDRVVDKSVRVRPPGETPPEYKGTGPSHYWGTSRGEDRAKSRRRS